MADPEPQLIKDKEVDKGALEDIMGMFWDKHIEVYDVELEPATSRGNNFISDAWIVRFEYKNKRSSKENGTTSRVESSKLTKSYPKVRKDGIGKSIFAKSRPEDEEHNKLMSTDIAFKNEIHSYENIILALSVYSNGPLRVPTYIHGNPTTIALEDMANKSFKSMNRKYVTSWNQVWSPIQEMARLHAASMVMKKFNIAYFRDLVEGIEQVPLSNTVRLGDMQATTIDTTIQLLKLSNGPDVEEHIKILEELQNNNVWEKQREIINRQVPNMVVNHGNFWINNLMYRKDMTVLFDWQHVVYSSPATDLCFFLYVNFASELLTNQRKAVLDYYLMHLHQNIYDVCVEKQMKIDEIDYMLEPLTYEWINDELKRVGLCGYMMAQWINPIFYWSDAVFDKMEKVGGMESMSVEERLQNMTSEQKDRVIQLTNVFIQDYLTVIDYM